MAVIETKNVTYTYPGGTKQSITNISINIEKGEFTLITGPSRCGKTTLGRCFNGLIPHFYQGELEGKTLISGMNVVDHPIHELAKRVGFVFQNPENQLFALSVEKDVAFGLENLGLPREEMRKKVDWALNLTGIYDLNKKLSITVVLVEHRLDLTAKYANHIIIMDEGKVVQDGDPREILRTEEARLVGVGIPKATLLYQILKKDGAKLGETDLF